MSSQLLSSSQSKFYLIVFGWEVVTGEESILLRIPLTFRWRCCQWMNGCALILIWTEKLVLWICI